MIQVTMTVEEAVELFRILLMVNGNLFDDGLPYRNILREFCD